MSERLDAQSRRFLELHAAEPGSRFEQADVAQARAALKQTIAACDIDRLEVGACKSMSIAAPGGTLQLRCYYPLATRNAAHPIALLLHGGGWALSDLDDYDNLARFLCRRSGALVVSVDYRLAPEHKFPAALDDCYAAFRWAAANAAQLGGDPQRLAVIGDSAGGNLAASICHIARDRDGPPIRCQALLYPLLALYAEPPFVSREKFGNGDYFISRASIQWTIDLYLETAAQARDPRASPILSKDFSRLPPALILTAGHDPLRDEGAAYAAKLRDAGGSVEHRCFESTLHGFLSFAGALDAGRAGLEYVGDWLRARLD